MDIRLKRIFICEHSITNMSIFRLSKMEFNWLKMISRLWSGIYFCLFFFLNPWFNIWVFKIYSTASFSLIFDPRNIYPLDQSTWFWRKYLISATFSECIVLIEQYYVLWCRDIVYSILSLRGWNLEGITFSAHFSVYFWNYLFWKIFVNVRINGNWISYKINYLFTKY